MAVRHGYGKIAGADALVFAYDTGDTRNSYRGEPTENLVYTNSNVYTLGASTFPIDPPVKEVFNGSTQANLSWTDHLRWYNETIPSGTTITISGWYMVYHINPTTAWQSSARLIIYSSAGYGGTVCNPGAWNTWKYFEVTYTVPSDTTSFRLEDAGYDYYNDADKTNTTAYGCNYQLELKSHATQFVNGTRSATEGLKDLTGNTSVDLSNVSFDSDAIMTFDGTDDYMSIASSNTITDYSQPFTMETIFKVDTNATWDNGYRSNIFSIAGSYGGMYGLFKYNNTDVGIQLRDGDSTTYAVATNLSKGGYYHLVGTSNGLGTVSLYLNGVLTQDNVGTLTGAPDSQGLFIGGSRAFGGAYGNHYQGEIPVAKYYNRALTAAEVKNNFNNYKSRFNL